MDFFQQFIDTFWAYLDELWFSLLLGFFLSGIFREFIPASIVERHFGDKKLSGILLSILIGVLTPLCCVGSLPVAMTMRRKGAHLGSVLAFLVASPATSIQSVIVSAKLLGVPFTVYIFFAVILMSVIIGIIGNFLHVHLKVQLPQAGTAEQEVLQPDSLPFFQKIKSALTYGFIQLPKEIGFDLVLGISIASFLVIFTPFHDLIKHYLTGAWGYVAVLVGGLVTYVCCTASVPMADALLKSGMTPGHAMTYLLVGPLTSYATILIMFKQFGGRILAVYLFTISFLSFLLGIMYNVLPFGK